MKKKKKKKKKRKKESKTDTIIIRHDICVILRFKWKKKTTIKKQQNFETFNNCQHIQFRNLARAK